MELIVPRDGESNIDLVTRCGGWYECPKDGNGKRLGPLVGYAARYDGDHQWVGDVYVNFAKVERHLSVLDHFAARLGLMMCTHGGLNHRATVFCGLPMGGLALAQALARVMSHEYIFLEKEVVTLKTNITREKARLIIGRHEVEAGSRIILVEDVANNWSTTADAVNCITEAGGRVVAIACFLNRSLDVEDVFQSSVGPLPVVALVRHKIMEYKQDDPAVAQDVADGNVVWKPKSREGWARLQATRK